MKTLAILGYHKIGDPPGGWQTWNYVSEKIFESHLQYLKNNEWQVIDVKQFLAGVEMPATLPEKAALITFDDGYRSNLHIALPILKKFSYPAIVFVPTGFVGGYNAFDADIFYEPKEDICTWEELMELEKNNVSIQSHSVTHRHFSTMSIAEQIEEVTKSKQLIETNLKKNVDLFSFPYGDDGKDHLQTGKILANANYKAAFLYGGPAVELPLLSKYRLTRVPVGADSELILED